MLFVVIGLYLRVILQDLTRLPCDPSRSVGLSDFMVSPRVVIFRQNAGNQRHRYGVSCVDLLGAFPAAPLGDIRLRE
jgi:hypothetical protein